MITQSELQEIEDLLDREHVPFVFDKARDRMTRFLEDYEQLPESERATVRSRFGPQHGGRLLQYACDMAVRAVRERSARDLERGLLAIAFEGTRGEPFREISTLCMLHHSAQKIGIDPVPLFREAARYGSERSRDFILDYLANGTKDIRMVRLEEAEGPEGFRYAGL
jgi:hypothetical protein